MTEIMSLMISSLLPMMKHPLTMGLLLIIQTLIISLMTSMMTKSFWMSYMLIITMMSGMLILFMYMASVASNEKFYSSMKSNYMTMLLLMTTMMLPFLMDQMESKKIWSIKKTLTNENEILESLYKLFNNNTLIITLFLIMYLFITMIIVSYIVNMNEGPLRKKN